MRRGERERQQGWYLAQKTPKKDPPHAGLN